MRNKYDRVGHRATAQKMTPSPGKPTAPKTLTPEAKSEWNRVVKELDAAGAISKLDRAILTMYCQAWAIAQLAQVDIDERGVLVPGDRGMVKNPSLQIRRDASAEAGRWMKELGLTPASRSRIVPLSDEDSEEEGDAGLFS